MNARRAAPAAITMLLAILGGGLITADEPSSLVPADIVDSPAAVTERAAVIGKDIQDAAVAEPASNEPKRPAEAVEPGGIGGIPSTGRPSSSRSRQGEDPDRAEMLLRLSSPDFISGIRMKFGEEDVKKSLDAMRKSNPNVTFEIDGNTIIARGSVADLRTLRSSLLTLGQTEDAKDWPPGLEVHVYDWRAPGGVSPESAAAEKTMIVQLEHLPVSSAANVLRNVFPSPPNKVQVGTEPSTNTLILRGPTEQLEEFQAILLKLDQPSKEPPQLGGNQFGRAGTMQLDSEIRVYPLRYVLAQELAPTLRELYAENIKVTVNDRANSLLVFASPETLGRIEDLVRQLDQPADITAATERSDEAKPRAAVEAEREYAAAERQASALALRLQKEQDLRDARLVAEMKSALRKAVSEAFEKRQLHQRMELELIRASLKAIQNGIDRRERIREEIIDRRVEELLKPELRWDPDKPSAAPDDDGLGTTQVPPPLDGMVTAVASDNLIGNLIEISLGSDDGLRVGQRLEVFRDDTNLGHAVVQRIDPDRAVAKVDDKTKQGTIQVGDGVATKLNPKTSPPGDSDQSPQDKRQLGGGLATSADVAVAEMELSATKSNFNHIEELVKKGYQSQSNLEAARGLVEAAQARVHKAQREYEGQRRLLQLDVESAKVNVNAAAAALETAAETYRRGAGPPPNVQHFALQQAELELKRAETLLALHTGDLRESQDVEETPTLEAPEQNAGPREAEAEVAIWRSFGTRVRAMSKVGMPGDRYNGGLIIRELHQDGPAAKADLQQGDIIVGVGKRETLSPANLLFALTSVEAAGDYASEGRSVRVLFLREAQLRSTTVTLGSVPAPSR